MQVEGVTCAPLVIYTAMSHVSTAVTPNELLSALESCVVSVLTVSK